MSLGGVESIFMKKLLSIAFLPFLTAPFLSAELTVHTISDSSAEVAVGRDPISEESLIRQGAPTLERVETPPLGKEFNVAKFNDGTLDGPGASYFRSLWVIFHLNTKNAPNGYDITEIRVYSGNEKLTATIFQNYDVYYHVAGAPQEAWDLLMEGVKLENSEVGVSKAEFFSRGQQTTIVDSDGKSIMQNVDAIKIDFRKRVLAYPDYNRFAEVTDESDASSTSFQEIVVLGKSAE